MCSVHERFKRSSDEREPNSLCVGHPSQEKMVQLARRKFWWFSLQHNVHKMPIMLAMSTRCPIMISITS